MTHTLTGRKQTPEHIAKRVAACRASGGYDAHIGPLVAMNKARIGTRHSEETKRKISESNKGMRNALGCKRSVEYRRKLSEYWAEHREEHNHYKDGNGNSARKTDMSRLEYRLWREAVFERDDWTCQTCGQRGGKLRAHHIEPYAENSELRLSVRNGTTLCQNCHLAVHTKGIAA
jgi:5-methylcytosine-specific restriction endonuclease McrA